MADLEGTTQIPEDNVDDIEMVGEEDAAEGVAGEDEETAVATVNPQTVFLEYLKSPIVAINIGTGAEKT